MPRYTLTRVYETEDVDLEQLRIPLGDYGIDQNSPPVDILDALADAFNGGNFTDIISEHHSQMEQIDKPLPPF